MDFKALWPKLRLYSTLSRKSESLLLQGESRLSLYVCGVTAYDRMHLGHARVFVVFDAWVRFLRTLGLEVTYARNVTDIDDKIILRARELEALPLPFVEDQIRWLGEDEAALGLLKPEASPRVTQSLQDIFEMIKEMIQKNVAYVTSLGNVYFKVQSFEDYGALSGRRTSELLEGVRIENSEDKADPLDFALWKSVPDEETLVPEERFDSPWGKGRPGWHIECSAMIRKVFGRELDVHGGGPDLIFPHHENERAQSCAVGDAFARLWMHVGPLLWGKEKMSKSLGNFITAREALASASKDALRLYFLQTQYRQPLHFLPESLTQAKGSLERLSEAFFPLLGVDSGSGVLSVSREALTLSPLSSETPEQEEFKLISEFFEALTQDFNTPVAVGILFKLSNLIQTERAKDETKAKRLSARLYQMGQVLGLFQFDLSTLPEFLFERLGLLGQYEAESGFYPVSENRLLKKGTSELLKARAQARKDRDYQASDAQRARLLEEGYTLRDVSDSRVLVFGSEGAV